MEKILTSIIIVFITILFFIDCFSGGGKYKEIKIKPYIKIKPCFQRPQLKLVSFTPTGKRYFSTKPIKTILVRVSFFERVKTRLTSTRVILSIILTILLGLFFRSLILSIFEINGLNEIYSFTSIVYFSFLAIIKHVIYCGLDHIEFDKITLSMDGSNRQQGGQTGNNPQPVAPAANNQNAYFWGDPNQPRAGIANGPMQVDDTSSQAERYVPNGNNQPFLRNLGMALEHQYRMGNTSLSAAMFTPNQEKFILEHLLHTNVDAYNKVMGHITTGYQGSEADSPKWWNQANSRDFRSNFR